MEPRAILTDIGNVLITFGNRQRLLAGMSKYHGGTCTPELLERIFLKGSPPEITFDQALNTGRTGLRIFWEAVCAYGEKQRWRPMPYHVFYALWTGHLQPAPEAIELFVGLRCQYPLIAVSDGNADGWEYLSVLLSDVHGLGFDELFLSAYHGACKPELFRSVVEYLDNQGYRTEECVYIDDVLDNISAAQSLGFRVVHFDVRQQSVDDLKWLLLGVDVALNEI